MPPFTVKVRVTSAAAVLKVRLASLVMPSLLLLPLSLLNATVGWARVLSRVKVTEAFLLLPAVSVSVTSTVWLPSLVGAV